MKKIILIILTITLFLVSCEKKQENLKDYIKKIDDLIYNKNYSDAEKYINSLFFKENKLKKNEKKHLRFRLARLYKTHLKKYSNAYTEFKKLNKEFPNDIKLIYEIYDIAKWINAKDKISWLELLFEKYKKGIKIKKEYMIDYLSFLRSNKNYKKMKELINLKELFDKNDIEYKIYYVEIEEKENPKLALKIINNYLKNCKNDNDYDILLFRKMLIMENIEDSDIKEIYNLLNSYKTKKYFEIIEQKKKYYKEKINLSKKKK